MPHSNANRLQERQQEFLALIDEHKGIIYKIARMYAPDLESRNDLIQEMIGQLWRSFDSYDETRKWSTWMYRVALNVAISYLRKETRRHDSFDPLTEEILNVNPGGVQEELDERVDLLYAFINELNKLDKALMLLYLEERSYQEIAEILGITKTNVATKISRLKALLKRHFLQESE